MTATSSSKLSATWLARVQMFAGLTPRALDQLLALTTEVRHPIGKVLFRAGEPGDKLYVIVEGRIRISREVPGMGEEALAVLGPGDCFGELSMIDDAPRSADAHVHEACVALEIRKDKFEHLLYTNRDIGYEILWNLVRTLSSRLRETTDKVTFLAVTGRFS
jgi:CRP/FNR family transcriptional regulator, cyclic AMP receptor protein